MSAHVLLVDDDLAVLRVLDRALTRLGLRVSVAPDAPTAHAIVLSDPVQAVILDYRLPGMRGDVLLGQLVERDPSLHRRAIFMTGDISLAADEAIVATGCHCLHKPFPLKELTGRVLGLVASAPSRRPWGGRPLEETPARRGAVPALMPTSLHPRVAAGVA